VDLEAGLCDGEHQGVGLLARREPALQAETAGPSLGSTTSVSASKTARSRQKREIVTRQSPARASHSCVLRSR
jgi:hypothetical protein